MAENLGNQESVGRRLEYVQAIFRLSLVHLADLLGISLQSLEDWSSGKVLTEDSQRRLDVLYQAAQNFKEAGLEANLATKRRWIDTELEFMQGLAYDQDPIDAVDRLTKLVELGKKRRERAEWKDRLKEVQPRSILDDLPHHYPGE